MIYTACRALTPAYLPPSLSYEVPYLLEHYILKVT